METMNCFLCDNIAGFEWSTDDPDVKVPICFNHREAIIHILEFSKKMKCKYCGELITFVRTENNRTMPVDPDPTVNGGTIINHRGVTIKNAPPGILGWKPHFANCPEYTRESNNQNMGKTK